MAQMDNTSISARDSVIGAMEDYKKVSHYRFLNKLFNNVTIEIKGLKPTTAVIHIIDDHEGVHTIENVRLDDIKT